MMFRVFALVLCGFAAAAQTIIFDQNFNGGYSGAFSTGSYYGGSPSATNIAVLTSGGNPSGGCMQMTMKPTTTSDYYVSQAQLTTVSGNTDSNPDNYTLSFDAKGSRAANVQFMIQTWPGQYYGGSGPVINVVTNYQLSASNTWQTFQMNLGSLTQSNATAATWQLEFQINASQWGGIGQTDTLTLDNLILRHYASGFSVTSSTNPSTPGQAVTFTASLQTNGLTVSNATGQVVFSDFAGSFSTNTMSGGVAVSASVTNLPVGLNVITATYSGGNYASTASQFEQVVVVPPGPNLALYTDNLVNGFQNWSWATVNFQVYSGLNCISVENGGGYQALSLEAPGLGSDAGVGCFNTTPYASLTFWINGGTGGQAVNIVGLLNQSPQGTYHIASLGTNWQQITIPLSTLGVANASNCTGFYFQGDSNSAQPIFYVAGVELVGAPAPGLVHLGVNAQQALETVDARQFGLNTATWDPELGSTLPQLEKIGCGALRWPGGSTSDAYNWASDLAGNGTFQYIATNLGAQVFTTVNYGSGTAAEAAAWVLYANKTNHCGFTYWEVGNECYGSWETDDHAIPYDPYTYATNAAGYIQQMKAAYPAVPIKVGVVVVPGEDTYINNSNHFAVNPITGATNYGWTPVVLSVMKNLGVLPDFLIYHYYAQYTSDWTNGAPSPDSDPLLLQVAGNPSPLYWTDWASAAANLRQQITDYIGAPGTNIQLCVTENNSDAGHMGRQSTSLVNALYLADSTCQLMKTEFRSYIWWDLHNGSDTEGDFDPTLYGWRDNGDYGILSGVNSPYPTFYAEKLLQYFARPGDTVLSGTSDNLLLSAYAVRRTNGALTLLVLNKDLTTNLNAQIALTNFTPASSAALLSYGIPQDQAAETNGSAAAQDLAASSLAVGSNFSYVFPPLSLTLFTFSPGPSRLALTRALPTQLQLQVQGQPGTPYLIETATNVNAANWTSVTNLTLTNTSATITIPISPGTRQQFYRAVWAE